MINLNRTLEPTINNLTFLPKGTIIDDYVIERGLASGGFSYVYLARDIMGLGQYAIKEYLPNKLAIRNTDGSVEAKNKQSKMLFLKGRSLFFEEARVLSKIRHENIVRVETFFETNSTAYMVMHYEVGPTLEKYVVKNKVIVDDHFIIKVFDSLLNGVNVIHSNGLLHLDIKPANILIRHNENPLLLDFGAIQSYQNMADFQKRATIFTRCFSPPEQYLKESRLTPASDIYAIGASMRSCLDGFAPQASIDRVIEDKLVPAAKVYKKKYPKHFLSAIDNAMILNQQDRIQSVDLLKKSLEI